MTPNETDGSMKQSETSGSGGLSQTTGVILMVVITVGLAAVIGAFILGLGNEMVSPHDRCVDGGGEVLDGDVNTLNNHYYCLYEHNDTLVDMETGEVVIRGGVG